MRLTACQPTILTIMNMLAFLARFKSEWQDYLSMTAGMIMLSYQYLYAYNQCTRLKLTKLMNAERPAIHKSFWILFTLKSGSHWTIKYLCSNIYQEQKEMFIKISMETKTIKRFERALRIIRSKVPRQKRHIGAIKEQSKMTVLVFIIAVSWHSFAGCFIYNLNS